MSILEQLNKEHSASARLPSVAPGEYIINSVSFLVGKSERDDRSYFRVSFEVTNTLTSYTAGESFHNLIVTQDSNQPGDMVSWGGGLSGKSKSIKYRQLLGVTKAVCQDLGYTVVGDNRKDEDQVMDGPIEQQARKLGNWLELFVEKGEAIELPNGVILNMAFVLKKGEDDLYKTYRLKPEDKAAGKTPDPISDPYFMSVAA